MKNKKELINGLNRQGELDIQEVVEWTNRLLPHFVPDQHRYKVANRVTVRIVRYYLNQGLISKPDGYKGRHSRYGANQVIQILAIKSLQAQYVPLKKIGRIMASVQEPDLLVWLLENNLSEYCSALKKAGLQAAVHLAKLTIDQPPDDTEVFDLAEQSRAADGLPRVGYLFQFYRSGNLRQPFIYGAHYRGYYPTFLHPNEI